ncbi:hypothetical protein H5410_050238 [Solanum commersonii]|uniref:Uncharacterized protein n=1 Tax=Solanum commersonii TaxID=4109 RepID=A0A9J5WUU9_SOLCO|nr:hypothetical protein H5410_050238 [Solanum commersonii]
MRIRSHSCWMADYKSHPSCQKTVSPKLKDEFYGVSLRMIFMRNSTNAGERITNFYKQKQHNAKCKKQKQCSANFSK